MPLLCGSSSNSNFSSTFFTRPDLWRWDNCNYLHLGAAILCVGRCGEQRYIQGGWASGEIRVDLVTNRSLKILEGPFLLCVFNHLEKKLFGSDH